MATVGERIKEARKLRGVSRPELAARVGIPYPTLAGLENGDQASSTQLPIIAEELQVNARWLATGKGPRESATDGNWPEVLAYRTAVALGDGAMPDEYAETHKLKFRAESLRKKGLHAESLIVVHGRGESMMPTIRDGDAILVDTSDTARKDGRLVVVRYDGDLLAKRLLRIGSTWFLQSDNQADPRWRKPQPVDEIKDFEVIGRVRWVGGWRE